MNVHHSPEPTLADALKILETKSQYPLRKIRRITNDVHRFSTILGTSPDKIPANVLAIGRMVAAVEPVVLGITRKTLQNLTSLALHTIAASELIPGMLQLRKRHRPKTPKWAKYYDKLPSAMLRNSLSRLANFGSRNGIEPEEVTTAVIASVMAEMEITSFRANQYQVHRTMCKAWNEVCDLFPKESLQKVAVPPSRLRKTRVPLDQLSVGLLDDWAEYSRWAQGNDIFGDDARKQPLRQSTLDIYFRRLHHCVSVLAEEGISPSSIQGIADLLEINIFKAILRKLHEKGGGKASFEAFFTSRLLLQLARDWVKVGTKALDELKGLAKRLPTPIPQMTVKNKAKVDQFDDQKVKERFLLAPDRIWEEVLATERHTAWTLAKAQAALSLHILMYMPVRLGNLTDLKFGEHLVLRESEPSTLRLSEDETKTGAAVEFNIPEVLAARLRHYRDEIAAPLLGKRPDFLFSNADSTGKGFAAVRGLIQRYSKQYIGVHMNPHVFRHLAAKFILDERPDAHAVVQHLLGHKKVETTVQFYAGVDTKRAGRHHQALLQEAMAQHRSTLAKAKVARPRVR